MLFWNFEFVLVSLTPRCHPRSARFLWWSLSLRLRLRVSLQMRFDIFINVSFFRKEFYIGYTINNNEQCNNKYISLNYTCICALLNAKWRSTLKKFHLVEGIKENLLWTMHLRVHCSPAKCRPSFEDFFPVGGIKEIHLKNWKLSPTTISVQWTNENLRGRLNYYYHSL
jgi:hypothetical protein